jgi:mannosyltransferase OCH1-like enzyme
MLGSVIIFILVNILAFCIVWFKATTTNPKATTTNPKATTTNPKATTTNPKATTTNPKAIITMNPVKVFESKRGALKTNTIPKIVIQTYKNRNLGPKLKQAMSSIQESNPSLTFLLFTDEECEDFICKNFGENSPELNAYMLLVPGAFKADIFRLCALYIIGGVYMDSSFYCSSQCSSSLEEQVEMMEMSCQTLGVVTEDYRKLTNIENHEIRDIHQALIIAVPKSPILRFVLTETVNRVCSKTTAPSKLYRFKHLWYTGPKAFGEFFSKYLEKNPLEQSYIKYFRLDQSCGTIHNDYSNSPVNAITPLATPSVLFLNTRYAGINKERRNDRLTHYSQIAHHNVYKGSNPISNPEQKIESFIPKNIFQSEQSLDSESQTSWTNAALLSGFTYKAYSEEEIDEFMKQYFSSLYPTFKKFPSLWRYCIIYKYGGVYADSGTKCKVPLEVFATANTDYITGSMYHQHVFVAPAESKLLKSILDGWQYQEAESSIDYLLSISPENTHRQIVYSPEVFQTYVTSNGGKNPTLV